MPEVLHNICNMGSRDLPDMSALALGRCAPSGSCVHIRQITPAHVTYITCYRIGHKFGGRKVWRIWRILPNRQTLFAKHHTIQLLLSVL